ncbi:MAG: hypothetical protein QM706_11135 [Nitrospira sp.]
MDRNVMILDSTRCETSKSQRNSAMGAVYSTRRPDLLFDECTISRVTLEVLSPARTVTVKP